jgi:hypothetical protein
MIHLFNTHNIEVAPGERPMLHPVYISATAPDVEQPGQVVKGIFHFLVKQSHV